MVVFNRFVQSDLRTNLGRVSALRFGRERAYCELAGEQRTRRTVPARRQFMQLMDARRKCVDMLRNFIEIIGRQPAQRSAVSGPTETGPVTSQGLTNVSPAFEAWLQAYRRRLEQVC